MIRTLHERNHELSEEINQTSFHFLTSSLTAFENGAPALEKKEWDRLLELLIQAVDAAIDSLGALNTPHYNQDQRFEFLKEFLAIETFFASYPSSYLEEYSFWKSQPLSIEKAAVPAERLERFFKTTEDFLEFVEKYHLELKRQIYATADRKLEHRWRIYWALTGGSLSLFCLVLVIVHHWESIRSILGKLIHWIAG